MYTKYTASVFSLQLVFELSRYLFLVVVYQIIYSCCLLTVGLFSLMLHTKLCSAVVLLQLVFALSCLLISAPFAVKRIVRTTSVCITPRLPNYPSKVTQVDILLLLRQVQILFYLLRDDNVTYWQPVPRIPFFSLAPGVGEDQRPWERGWRFDGYNRGLNFADRNFQFS